MADARWKTTTARSKLNTFDFPRWKNLEVILITDQTDYQNDNEANGDNDDNNDNDNDNNDMSVFHCKLIVISPMWQMQGGSSKLNTFDCPRWEDLEIILMTVQIDYYNSNDNNNDNNNNKGDNDDIDDDNALQWWVFSIAN